MVASSVAFARAEKDYEGPIFTDTTTVIHGNGMVEKSRFPLVLQGEKAVVVHPGRPDNGTEWGKHIEVRDQTPEERWAESHSGSDSGSLSNGERIVIWLIVKGVELICEALK